MHAVKRKNSKGNVYAFRFFVNGKDPETQAHKLYSKVWKIPIEILNDNEAIKNAKKKAMREYEDYVEEASKGIVVKIINENVKFIEYAEEWAERILIKNPSGFNYYIRAKEALKLFKKEFPANLLIRNLTPTMIQKFYDWLCTRTYTKNIVFVKEEIAELDKIIEDKKLKVKDISNDCGISRTTLFLVRQAGSQVGMEVAEKICKHFKLSFNKYFEHKQEICKYAKATNAGVRRILVAILSDAKKKKIIKENYSTKDYTDSIKGSKKEMVYFNEEEATEFVLKIMSEKDIRKKAVYSIMIFLGLRGAEVCGLEWCDINFETNELSVRQAYNYYSKEFESQSDDPKTDSSKRTITMPEQLVEVLKEYRVWWLEQKELHGDLWANTNYLFTRSDGKTRTRNTHFHWLKESLLEYGLRQIPAHSLRHTNATILLNAGVPITTIAKRLGHKKSSITLDIYSHALKKADETAATKINEVFCRKLAVNN
ncbi:MAG: tyrosine-type recombinase/integrase [Firmicutes bacterium]|nr:tyrosine-type recombinase/integrase [Bacillota bacterium]